MNKTAAGAGKSRNVEEWSRLEAAGQDGVPWRKWGPYLSERQWGTVREDYSVDGNAWEYFPHDHARSRSYNWGEDGLAGISDDQQQLCFAVALWNGHDPILKERLFGLTNNEGNHGEDVKEYYFYLDATPTHSYMKWLYKYPHRAFPYSDLVVTNKGRSLGEFEYELIDTGFFDGQRYFDIEVEYAKVSPEDILIRITATNRGDEAATLHLLPTIWFRNTWRLWPGQAKPTLQQVPGPSGTSLVAADHPELGPRWLCAEGHSPLLFTENETNSLRLFGQPNASPYVKDGINDLVVNGRTDAINPEKAGTKASVHHQATIAPQQAAVWRLRLSDYCPEPTRDPFAEFDAVVAARRLDADQFYEALAPASAGPDAASVMRQALAGMLWSKQYYFLDANRWLTEHGVEPFRDLRQPIRNSDWSHMINADVISMPDKW